MKILVLNGGSSTLKATLRELDGSLPSVPPPPLWEAQADWGRRPSITNFIMDHTGRGVKRKRRSAISQGRLRTSVLRQPPALTFDSAALDPWDGRAAWVARFDFPVFQNAQSAGEIQLQFGDRGGRPGAELGFSGGDGFVSEGVQVISVCSGWASKMGSFGNSSRRALSLSNSSAARGPEGAPWRSAWA